MNSNLKKTLLLLKEKYNIQDEEEYEDPELNVQSFPTSGPMLGEEEDCDELEEASNSTDAYAGGEGPQQTPYAFRKKAKIRKSDSYDVPVEETNKWFVKLENIYNKSIERIEEINYQQYRQDDSLTPRQKINSSIKEINKRLSEVERMIHHSQKFKNEIGADSGVFYADTVKKFQKISERLMRISSKIREFNT